MNTRRPVRAIVITAVLVLALSGCRGDDAPVTVTITESPSPTDLTTLMPSDSAAPTTEPPNDDQPPADEAPFPADRLPDTAQASADAALSPTSLRFGAHQGYDRIVLDLEGTGTPGWTSEYTDEPRLDGSGEPVDLEGSAYLVTTVTGLQYPTEEGAHEFAGQRRFQPDGSGVVQEVMYGDVFEGTANIYVGLSSEQPFRVFLLQNPTRLVIDVQTP